MKRSITSHGATDQGSVRRRLPFSWRSRVKEYVSRFLAGGFPANNRPTQQRKARCRWTMWREISEGVLSRICQGGSLPPLGLILRSEAREQEGFRKGPENPLSIRRYAARTFLRSALLLEAATLESGFRLIVRIEEWRMPATIIGQSKMHAAFPASLFASSRITCQILPGFCSSRFEL